MTMLHLEHRRYQDHSRCRHRPPSRGKSLIGRRGRPLLKWRVIRLWYWTSSLSKKKNGERKKKYINKTVNVSVIATTLPSPFSKRIATKCVYRASMKTTILKYLNNKIFIMYFTIIVLKYNYKIVICNYLMFIIINYKITVLYLYANVANYYYHHINKIIEIITFLFHPTKKSLFVQIQNINSRLIFELDGICHQASSLLESS